MSNNKSPGASRILKEDFEEWFISPPAAGPMLPYMLCTVRVRPEKADKIPSVVHVDQTARVQVVDKHRYPLMHKVLTAVKKRTNVPILINTSFNLKGDQSIKTELGAFCSIVITIIMLGYALLKFV